MVVAVGLTTTEVPFPSNIPPHDTEYQYHAEEVPNVPPIKDRVELDPPHEYGGSAVRDVGDRELVNTVIVILTHVVVLHVPCALI